MSMTKVEMVYHGTDKPNEVCAYETMDEAVDHAKKIVIEAIPIITHLGLKRSVVGLTDAKKLQYLWSMVGVGASLYKDFQ